MKDEGCAADRGVRQARHERAHADREPSGRGYLTLQQVQMPCQFVDRLPM